MCDAIVYHLSRNLGEEIRNWTCLLPDKVASESRAVDYFTLSAQPHSPSAVFGPLRAVCLLCLLPFYELLDGATILDLLY